MRLTSPSSFRCWLLLCSLLWLHDAAAWGNLGHRITGTIAESLLTAATRRQIHMLLGDESLTVAATIMDTQRARLSERWPQADRWHYDNQPVCGQQPAPCRDGNCATRKIEAFRAVLADRRAANDERATALRLLIHLLGDIHQPLHMADNADRGGNKIQVRLSAAGQQYSLHEVIDTVLVRELIGKQRTRDYALSLTRRYQAQLNDWQRGNMMAWAQQSCVGSHSHLWRAASLRVQSTSRSTDHAICQLSAKHEAISAGTTDQSRRAHCRCAECHLEMMQTPTFKLALPPRFPWRDGNQFELLVDGEVFFPRMLDAIAQAQRSIMLEMYLVSSGRVFDQFKQVLLDAAARNVSVRILLDGFGSQLLSLSDRQALNVPNIELTFFNRLRWRQGLGNLVRNHRKLLLVDEQLAFVGGTGLTDEFLYDQPLQPHWHEVMVAIRGPVVSDWLQLFERTWQGLRITLRKQRQREKSSLPAQGTQRGRVCASNGPRAHHVVQSLHQELRESKHRVWLVTPYFIPSLTLRRLLIQAAKRGLDVRMLVPGKITDHPAVRHASRRYYALLLRSGVRIFEYQPRFIHAKLVLCDHWLTLGSTNFDRWNMRWNLDANQEIGNLDFAAQVSAQLEHDFSLSEELHYDTWQQRPLYLRCLEWLNGTLDRWLATLR
jgi:cardiolipin synthase A/B